MIRRAPFEGAVHLEETLCTEDWGSAWKKGEVHPFRERSLLAVGVDGDLT
jgi:hypothetical protein